MHKTMYFSVFTLCGFSFHFFRRFKRRFKLNGDCISRLLLSQLFILGILAASFTAFLQEGFVLCCRLWISFSRFTQSCTFLFAVFPGSFLIFLTLGKLLFCKIFLVTVADFNLTRKRITDKIDVGDDLLLTVDRPSARCGMNHHFFYQFVQHFICQRFTVLVFPNQFDTQARPCTSLFCFLLYQLSLWWVKYRAQPEAIST